MQPVSQQPGVTVVPAAHTVSVVSSNPQTNPNQCDNYGTNQAYVLGVIQVVIGGLCFILQIAAIAIGATAANSAAGIWCGIVFGITGILGIMSSRSKGKGAILACMVMATIAAVACLPLLVTAAVGLGHDNNEYYCPLTWIDYSCYRIENKEAKVGLNACLLMLSLLECIVAIWASAVCCNAICCGRSRMSGVVLAQPGQQVQYVIQPQPGVYPSQPVTYQQPAYGQQPVYGQQPAYGQQPPGAQQPAYGQQPAAQPAYNPQYSAQSPAVPPSYSAEAPPSYNQIQSSAPPQVKN